MSSICGVIGYKGEKNCFLSLPKGSVTNETHEEVIVFEVLLEGRPSVYCSWAGETTSGHGRSEGVILLNGLYANKLGIPEDTPVVLRRLSGIPECSSLWVEPMSVDDWEILELNSQKVESGLLGQVRVVWTGQPLPVWLKNNFCIFVTIRDIAPPGKCALLVNNTEVIVSPKSRGGGSMSDRAIDQNTSNRTAKPSPASSDIGRKDFNPAVPSTKSESGLLNSWTTYLKSFVVAKDKVHTNSQENETVFKEGRHFILPKNFKCGFRAQCLCMEGDAAVYMYTCPTNVFVLCKDLARHIRPKCSLPDVMFARVTKLLSPELKRKEMEAKDSDKPKGENSSNETSRSSPAQKEKVNKSQTSPPVVIVRVIVVNKYNFRGSPEFRNLVKAATGLQPVVEGHVLTSDFLRRQLSVGVTDQVQLEPVYSSPQFVQEIELFQISDLPSRITSEMVVAAFRSWLKRSLSDGPPMVVFQQMLARFPILPELDLEVLLTFDLPEGREFGVITPKQRRNITITAHLRSNGQRKWPQISHNPVASARELDPPVPMVMLANLGGVSSLIPKALSHLEVCFAQRPLTQLVFPHLNGVRSGALLLTGVSGTGKSSFGKALCRRVAEYPYLAYTSVVECKTLKGKRPETVQTLLERVFDESSWRQPAVVLLDDVDVLAGAPTSADAEMTGKAHYANKMAEVVRTVLKTSAELGDRLAVILTSKSRGSLHTSLLPPRGQQVIHQVINMPAPTQAERKEILECILKSKLFVSRDCLSDLPLEDLSARMEGFVAQDVRTVVDRAIHAHQMSGYKPKTEPDGLLLCMDDFETALSGFKPMSYRNVSLHEETEVGWADVGGLQDVKATLIETLQWPTKYPRLFEACPLRLRSGLLLFGAPGTGKTLLARAVARECKLNFITIKGPELLSKYIGASEQAVRDTFARAHSAKPCILFFDEFDSIAPRRGHDSTGVTDRVVNQLLTQLDGVEALEGVFVLGATSRPDLIDPALLRPGRLDKCLYCRLPSAEERSEILSCLAKKMKFAEDVNLKEIATSCEHFTGADFKALLYNAQLEAIHEITPVLKNNVPVSSVELEKRTDAVCKSVPSILESCETRELIHQEQLVMSQDKKPTLAYFPCLENGPVPLEAREERRWLEQVNEFKGRQTKLKLIGTQSDIITKRQAYSENKTSHMIEVNQSHLLRAFQGMRPSVSANERLKFEKIYSNFVSTRGGDFEADALSTKRLTLA